MLLLQAHEPARLNALAECHLGSRQNRHQPLRALGEMAYAVLAAMENRLPQRRNDASASGRYLQPWHDGRAVEVPVAERPPLSEHLARHDESLSRAAS